MASVETSHDLVISTEAAYEDARAAFKADVTRGGVGMRGLGGMLAAGVAVMMVVAWLITGFTREPYARAEEVCGVQVALPDDPHTAILRVGADSAQRDGITMEDAACVLARIGMPAEVAEQLDAEPAGENEWGAFSVQWRASTDALTLRVSHG